VLHENPGYITTLRCVTFGAPLVGDGAFADALAKVPRAVEHFWHFVAGEAFGR
jgi:hypothetical protein